MPASRFWAGKRVLITGHTGFKGGWLCLWLEHLGARVQGYALAPVTNPCLHECARVSEGITGRIADIRDRDAVLQTVRDFRPEIVIHLAAQPLVRLSYVEPVETYATNVMGTVHLLDAVRQTGSASVVVNVTSDKCYENRETPEAYREEDPMGGFDPYSSSKGCAELVTSAYRRSFFSREANGKPPVSLASVRAGNVIGGGDWADDRVVPDLVRAASDGLPTVIRNPGAIRPWQHVLEPLHGYLLLAERLWSEGREFAEGWNFGPLDAHSHPVSWIADRFVEFWGKGASWQSGAVPGQVHEAHFLRLDSSKARGSLGWQPRWVIGDGLKNTVSWYQAYRDGADMRAYTIGQIKTYESTTLEHSHDPA